MIRAGDAPPCACRMVPTRRIPHEFPVDIPFVAPAAQAGGVSLQLSSHTRPAGRRRPSPCLRSAPRSSLSFTSTVRRPRRAWPAPSHLPPDLRIDNEPLPRPPDVLSQIAGQVRRRAWHYHGRVARLGRRLSQAVVGEQDRALYPWRELHRFLFLENLRQGRDRDVGNAADRLSPHPS